ncbi:Ribosomal RNA adenine dimethylase [Planctomycetes bacterium Poly30]|uniref:Ribosomal RNA adenine dimethylase n=1 Tax=Saltatorellus ferox TaxID=2528018 RepID=A0A518ERW2_9BACT|nr:Ribosomal RNA adenine dimethylase [Planctomycetes bacterium Poly30]
MSVPTSSEADPRGDHGAGPRPERPPWAEFKRALDAQGFHPSRRFGQNFLLDDNMARAIASDATARGPNDVGERSLEDRFVLEIGPGCGFLSVHLAHAGARLLAVEIDPKLAPIARRFLAPYPRAEVIEHDILASKSALNDVVLERLPGEGEDWTLCANLPYSISGPLLAICSLLPNPPERVSCLVQKEVAERLAAVPGTGDWGPLTAAFQETYHVSMGRSVPPQLFWPRPKVDSAVFIATRHPVLPPLELRKRRVLFARKLLERRRQSLRRVLGDLRGAEVADAALGALGIDPKRRAETLGLPELRALEAYPGDAADPPGEHHGQ